MSLVNHRDGREVQPLLDLASLKPLSGSDRPRRGLWKQDHFKVPARLRRSMDWDSGDARKIPAR